MPRRWALATCAYCGLEKMRVTLMLIPSAISSSIAGMPAGVPGTLTKRFGRLTSFQSRLASMMLAAVSCDIAGGSSRLTNPSRPFPFWNRPARRSAVRMMSCEERASKICSADLPSPARREMDSG
jgi:hypothetical protein